MINPREVCSIARRVHGLALVRELVWEPLVQAFHSALEQAAAAAATAVAEGAAPARDRTAGGETLLGFVGALEAASGAGLFASVAQLPPAAAHCFELHACRAGWRELEHTLRFLEDREHHQAPFSIQK